MTRLKLTAHWQAEWLRVVTALREELKAESPHGSATVQELIGEWSQQLDAVTSDDGTMRTKLLDALQQDPHLQKRWLVDEELLRFVHQMGPSIVHDLQ